MLTDPTPPPNPNPSPDSFHHNAFILGTFGLGLLYYLCIFYGVIGQWEKLPPPPVPVKNFWGNDHYDWGFAAVYLVDELGNRYEFSPNRNEIKYVKVLTDDQHANHAVHEPCSFNSVKFLWIKTPFREVRDCIWSNSVSEDLFSRSTITHVFDEDGNLWAYSEGYAYPFCMVPILLFISVPLGLVANLIWVLIQPKFLPRKTQRQPAEGKPEMDPLNWGIRLWARFLSLIVAPVYIQPYFNKSLDEIFSQGIPIHTRQVFLCGVFLLASYAVAWRWERLGGMLGILGFIAAFYFNLLGFNKTNPFEVGLDWWLITFFITSPVLVPPVLFLISGNRKARNPGNPPKPGS